MLNTTVQHFIVIGNPIAHSKSPDIHQSFAKQTALDINYARQYCPDNKQSFIAVVDAFFNGGGRGANVTVPFKQTAYELCLAQGKLSEHASVAGAVNTLSKVNGQLRGNNTDGQGLVNHLKQLGWSLDSATVAIIGAGGAARGVILPLVEAGIAKLTIANRTISKAEMLVHELTEASTKIANIRPNIATIEDLAGHYDLVINATSIGLSGNTLSLNSDLKCDYAYDMMYGRTLPFLIHFQQLGAQTSDGYGMLIAQAALSFNVWTGKSVDTTLFHNDQ